MSAPTLTIKRGDSLDFLATIPSHFADGHFAGWAVSAQVRSDKDELFADLEVDWIDEATTRALRLLCLDTSAWKPGRAQFDIQLRRPDGYTISSATTPIYVEKDVTRG